MAGPGPFGSMLKRHRLAAGLTQEELAERGGLSPRGVGYLEAGGRAPRPGTVRRLAEALQLDADDMRALREASERLGGGDQDLGASYRLEPPLTAILGREAAVTEAVSLLSRPEVRLLTLIGGPGIGKTRLAQHVLERYGPELADGYAAVALDSVREPEVVLSAVAAVLGVRQEHDRPLARAVAEHLQGGDTLLLLDNFEQVLDAAPTVVTLLRDAPRLKVLVTSRSPLGVPGEQELAVSPLSLPDETWPADLDSLRRSPAAALFLERARAIRPQFAVDEGSAASIARICGSLDGLPLAIELAAARLRILTPEQVAARLDRDAGLLGQPDTAPGRQRTLQAALDWSYDLLSGPERGLFRRLSVCVGGWTVEAAEALCTSGNALDLLTRLVEQSLAVADQRGSVMRYRYLHPVRRYAQQRLEESGEADAAAAAHAAHLLTVAEQAATVLAGVGVNWLDRLEQDHANLREALWWLRDHGPEGDGLRLASALWRFWWLRGYVTEGRDFLRGLLQGAGEAVPVPLRTRALQSLGELTWRQGDRREAREALERARRLAGASGDRRATADAERTLSRLAVEEGSQEEARALLASCLRTDRELRDGRGLAVTLSYVGWLDLEEGRPAAAEEHLNEALALSREREDRVEVAVQLISLAQVALERGDVSAAGADAAAGLRIFDEIRFRAAIPHALEGTADVAAARGDNLRALRLAGAAAALRETAVCFAVPELRARHERTVAGARAVLGAAAPAVWAAGRGLTLREAVDEALAPEPAHH